MTGVQVAGAILSAAIALALMGCTSPQPIVGSPSGSSFENPSPSGASSENPSDVSSSTLTQVTSAQPDPLIDLDCSDFAGVASIGTIAGVTERDPRGVVAEILDVVPLADIVRNAGGLACEFSDGGGWRATDPEGGQSLNTAWRGAAIFVVPNVGAKAGDLASGGSCGDPVNGRTSVCITDFVAGSSWVTVVSSTNDRKETFFSVRDYVKDAVSSAGSKPGPIARAPGTFQPPRDCASLVPTAEIALLLGGSDVLLERPIQLHVAAEATFVTENIGCQWFRDAGDSLAQVQVYPGGGWAAELTLPSLNATPVKVAGLGEGDMALSHCSDVSQYGFWICTLEVVAGGTWLRAIGSAPDEAAATTIAIALAEATLSLRR